ncbi:MAG TPA: FxsC protein [Pyrinomonadaceae bacterium]|nr:FxsC protein [Pyrinomonadaceae bacterium]
MGYDFFFSYKRVSDTSYQKQFFNDLSNEIRALREVSDAKEAVGFFDQRGIEQGEEWEPSLAIALQESKVLVCAYSTKYFESEYCGKEWQVFKLRRDEYRRLKEEAGEPNVALPAVIKPVLWMELPADLDPKFKKTQFMWGDPNEIQNQKGLRYVLQFKNKYENEYKEYINRLAEEIISVGKHHQLPKLPNLPNLGQVSSAFARATQPEVVAINQPAPKTISTPAKRVVFIFAAAEPSTFAGKRDDEAYRDQGGADWKPFFPQIPKRIGTLVQNLVSDDALDLQADELPLNDNLIKEIEKAYEERKIVVIMVDGWTLVCKDEYRALLEKFDQETKPKYVNHTVLVPWNDQDPENAGKKGLIEQMVKNTFSFRAEMSDPIHYRDSIRSVQELREVLGEVLIKIRAKMHKNVENVNAMPRTIAQPIISNEPVAAPNTVI